MEKFITKEEVESKIPVEPRFLRFKILVGAFTTATIMGLIMSIIFTILIGFPIPIDTETYYMILPLMVSYLTIGLFSLMYITEKRVFMTPNIVQKWLGIREYQEQTFEYYSILYKYEHEQNFKKSQEHYKNHI